MTVLKISATETMRHGEVYQALPRSCGVNPLSKPVLRLFEKYSVCSSVSLWLCSRIGFLVLCVVISFMLPVTVQARPVAPLAGLEALRKGFAGISDFTAEITQEKRLSIMKRSLVTQGSVRFRKPDLFMLEINPPYESRLLLRDNVIEQATGKGGEHSRIILPPEQSLKRWFSKLAGPITSLPEGVAVHCDLNGSLYILSLSPSGQGQIKSLTISFLENGTIQRLVIDEKNGDRATMTFKKMRRNIGLTEKDFRLE